MWAAGGMQGYQLERPLMVVKQDDEEQAPVLRLMLICHVAGCCFFFAFIWAAAMVAPPPNFSLTKYVMTEKAHGQLNSYTPKSKEPSAEELRTRDDSPWNTSALQSLRTSFHFQPPNHWMNDPNAPLYYKGWYHLFYQYNPEEAYWGLISWGHTISRDLIHWLYLEPLAMTPDHWYDQNGVWTGSATMLSLANGHQIPAILYTGSTNDSVQVQNVAFPTDPSDALLRFWTKIPQDPVLTPPPFINVTDFRDPTTAWRGNDGMWTTAIGSHLRPTHTGMALLFQSHDFVNWSLVQDTFLHLVNGTGMWECVDFYPVAASGEATGLDTSTMSAGGGVKHVLKASMDDSKLDFYTIGTYDPDRLRFTADDAALDLGLGLRYDYGRFYASKTFFDPLRHRRILFGWINESDTIQDDVLKGWSGIQSIPRQVWFDNFTNQNLIQWPIEEVTSLHTNSISTKTIITLESGSIMKIEGGEGAQWDITLSFDKPQLQNWMQDSLFKIPSNKAFSLIGCDQRSINHNSSFGPFGIYVLSSEDLQEQTGIYFYLVPMQPHSTTTSTMPWRAFVCNDLTRSSLASNLDKGIHGGPITILEEEEELSIRILVDHSVIETFSQGGRTVVTSRVYPTIALNDSANLYLFNNACLNVFVKQFEAWRVSSIGLHDYKE